MEFDICIFSQFPSHFPPSAGISNLNSNFRAKNLFSFFFCSIWKIFPPKKNWFLKNKKIADCFPLAFANPFIPPANLLIISPINIRHSLTRTGSTFADSFISRPNTTPPPLPPLQTPKRQQSNHKFIYTQLKAELWTLSHCFFFVSRLFAAAAKMMRRWLDRRGE